MQCTEAVKKQRSINVPLQQHFQCGNGCLCVRAISGQNHSSAGDDTQGHDTQQALGVHTAAAGLNPNGAVEFICLLHEVCSLLVMQTGFTTNNNFLAKHNSTLLIHNAYTAW